MKLTCTGDSATAFWNPSYAAINIAKFGHSFQKVALDIFARIYFVIIIIYFGRN